MEADVTMVLIFRHYQRMFLNRNKLSAFKSAVNALEHFDQKNYSLIYS